MCLFVESLFTCQITYFFYFGVHIDIDVLFCTYPEIFGTHREGLGVEERDRTGLLVTGLEIPLLKESNEKSKHVMYDILNGLGPDLISSRDTKLNVCENPSSNRREYVTDLLKGHLKLLYI